MLLKPSAFYPVSSVDGTRKALCKMSKMVVKVRLSKWDASANAWTNDFATTWNYGGDPKANIEDLRQAVAGHMVLGKVRFYFLLKNKGVNFLVFSMLSHADAKYMTWMLSHADAIYVTWMLSHDDASILIRVMHKA